jgi:DNA-directed RNA polymerase specialized sigma24 family protein
MATAKPEELGCLRPKLLAFAMRRVGDPERAEDAVSSSLVAAEVG